MLVVLFISVLGLLIATCGRLSWPNLWTTFGCTIKQWLIVWLTDISISKSFLCHHCVVLYTVYVFYARQHMVPRCTLCNSRPRLLPRLPLPIPTPLKLALLAQAAVRSRLRPRCCCCCYCCRPAADCTQKLQVTISAAVEPWQTGFNSVIVQHVRCFLGPTDVQPVVSK